MPLYEYACDKCGCEFEELVFDDANPICPKCGSQETRKLMSCCACHRNGDGGDFGMPASGGGGCAGCSGGHCSSCGH